MSAEKKIDALFARLESAQLVETWGVLSWPRRSSRYFLSRHRIIHARAYEAALAGLSAAASPALLARRGRILRLLGRRDEALADFERALRLDESLACAHAWRWEALLDEARQDGRISFDGIDRAVALEPRNPWWRIWRAIGVYALPGRPRGRLSGALADCRKASAIVLANLVGAAIAERLSDPAGARRALDKAIRLDPRLYFAYIKRGQLRLEAGDVAGFMADHERGILLEERAGFFTATIGGRNIAASAPEPCVSLLCSTVEFPASLKRAGRDAYWITALRRGGAAKSLKTLAGACDAILKRRPDAYWIYALRGNCRRLPEIADLAGARADFEAALRLKPSCSWAWAYLSRVHMATAAEGPAMEAIGRAIALRPDCGWFHIWRGEVRRWFGDTAGSLPDFERGLRLAPDYEFAYAWRAGAKRALGRPAEALEDLDMAIRFEPGYAWALHQRSLALRELGRIKEAIAPLDAAHALDSRYVWCAKASDAAAAIAQLDRALAADPSLARAFAWRGQAKSVLGDAAGATKDFDRCLALSPGDARALAWRGWENARRGRRKQGLLDLDRAIALDAGQAPAFARRGRLRHQLGRPADALKDLDKAASLEPQTTETFEWRAGVLIDLRDWKAAAADLERVKERRGGAA